MNEPGRDASRSHGHEHAVMAAAAAESVPEGRLHLFPDRSPDGELTAFLVTDPHQADNPIIAASTAFTRMTGYAPPDVMGRNCRFLQGPGTDPSAVEQLRRAIEAGDDLTITLLNYRKDGSTFWNELTIGAVRDAFNRVTHFVGVQIDVTAREEARRTETAPGDRETPPPAG